MQDDDDIPSIKKQKICEEEQNDLEFSQMKSSSNMLGKFYCSDCNMAFDRDDEMLYHQEECKKNSGSENALTLENDINRTENEECTPSQKSTKNLAKKEKLKKHLSISKGSESSVSKPLTPRKREERYRCNNCTQQFRKEEKMLQHVAKCSGELSEMKDDEEKAIEDIEPIEITKLSEDSLNDKKTQILEKNVAITVINEENVDHLRDAKTIGDKVEKEGNDDVPDKVEEPIVETPTEAPTTPKKGRGRPKKILEISKILEQVPPSPPPSTLPKRASSTSRRTSSSSRASTAMSTASMGSLSNSESMQGAQTSSTESIKATNTKHTSDNETAGSVPEKEVEANASNSIPDNKNGGGTPAEAPTQPTSSNTRPKRSRKVIEKDL